MNTEDFNEIILAQIELCKSTLIKKAKEYATDDRLHNFKTAAKLEHMTPIQALAGMMAKHTVSVYDLCAEAGETDAKLELWEEKITDHINYLLLLKALVVEQKPRTRYLSYRDIKPCKKPSQK